MTEYSTQDYIKYRLQEANDTLNEVEIHIRNEFCNTAINRMYYACFYAVNALIMKEGVEISSHAE
ncbi:MAG: HEPN domain-containing protein [Paludibacter sp.]